jgi:hypothetical protein
MNIEATLSQLSTKPYTRWWWFSGHIQKEVIDKQLSWLSMNGFGGVEIAWVYPKQNTTADEGPQFLDKTWIDLVTYALERCRALGLGCDLTLGSLWPFGGSFIPKKHAAKSFTGILNQRIEKSFESRYLSEPGIVLDHLNKKSLDFYFNYFLQHGFQQFAYYKPLCFFCDSIEINTEDLSYEGLFQEYLSRYGEDLSPYIFNLNNHPHIRYNYRKLISEHFLSDFFGPYVQRCHEVEAIARVQCHGALTNLIDAYSLVDIPESEVLLFDPKFSLIASSAASLTGKNLVSSESFSCIYGWKAHPGPAPYIKQEDPLDIKCVADAQFAFGINHIIWHGMPYGSGEQDTEFYASVHVGLGGSLTPVFSNLNRYFSEINKFMRRGKPVSRLAVYFPIEDQWMADSLPDSLKKPSSNYYWECQELEMPNKLLPYRPLWVSQNILSQAFVTNSGTIVCGNQEFDAIYSDAAWMEEKTVKILHSLKQQGAKIILATRPQQPGTIGNPNIYNSFLTDIGISNNTQLKNLKPLLESEILLDYWVRNDNSQYYIFIAHPGIRNIRYPLLYKFHTSLKFLNVSITFTSLEGTSYPIELQFFPNTSILLHIDEKNHCYTISTYGKEILEKEK